MFEVYGSKEFFDQFVRRTYKDYLASPLDEVRVKTVVHQMNVMAERTWINLKDSELTKIEHAQTAGAFRRHLVESESKDFQIVWDLDDGSVRRLSEILRNVFTM